MAELPISQKPLIFDLFHTLVDPDDFRPSGFRRLQAAAAVLGVDFPVLEAAWTEALPELVRGRDSVRGLLRRVAHDNGRPARTLDISPAAEPLGRYQDLALLHPRQAILQLLNGLEAGTVGMLTNCHDRDVEAWLQSPLAKHIDAAVFSTKAHHAKPDIEAYEVVIDALRQAPVDMIYVGNGGDDELAGARSAGIGTVVHFTYFDDMYGRTTADERARRSTSADFTVSSVPELADLLAG